MVTVAPTSPFDVPVFLGGALGGHGYLADHVTTCTSVPLYQPLFGLVGRETEEGGRVAPVRQLWLWMKRAPDERETARHMLFASCRFWKQNQNMLKIKINKCNGNVTVAVAVASQPAAAAGSKPSGPAGGLCFPAPAPMS